jgi:pimeloyl-ACP methyl ester carboxylesterase
MIGVVAANREPERFEKLVLIGPSPCYVDDGDYVGGFSRADIDELLESLDSNYLGWSSAMAPVIMGNPDRPELGEELTNSFCSADPEIARQFARVTFLSDNRLDLPGVGIPAPLLQMQGAVREVALEIVCADGGRMPVLVNSTLSRDATGAPVAIHTAVFQATDRREYERELLRARDREQQARGRAEALQQAMARLAEENAQLYERERGVARTLQTSLLAGEPPRDPRFPVATHYSPGIDTLEVGGDWHDAIALDGDGVGISVGDVVGRGIEAASTMGQLRSATRALACTRLGPS